MKTNSLNQHFLKVIPIGGWIFILIGVIWPLENRILYILWLIDIFLSFIVHPLQLLISIPIGKKMNIPILKIIFMTFIFGGTYWKPLKKKLNEQKSL